MKVVRYFHGGRDAAHRERDRALAQAGIDLTLIVPSIWKGHTGAIAEKFDVLEVPVTRPGDINRHRLADPSLIGEIIAKLRPDIVDLHAEPFSGVVHQFLRELPPDQVVVTYTAQNIDKRFPPPFAGWELKALGRIEGIYPCSRQAASVVVGKGFDGAIKVLPLAPSSAITLGNQPAPVGEIRMLLVGRFVPQKGVLDAVRVLAEVRQHVSATLLLVGAGPEEACCHQLAQDLGVSEFVQVRPWLGPIELAANYREAQILLAPSRSTRTWVEQFGRMIVEAQAAGAVIVGYSSGSLPEVVGVSGTLVPEGDVAALARAVLQLQENPQRWLQLRNAGLELAARRTWDAVAEGQIELYEQAQAVQAVPRRRVSPHRHAAIAKFGEPAHVFGGGRPFALPIIRADNRASRVLARALDYVGVREAPVRSDRLRLVYIDHIAKLSGGELALARLIGALPRVDAHVILGEEGPLRQALESAGATVEVLPVDPRLRDARRGTVGAGLDGIRSIALTARHAVLLARRLRQLRPDVVHTNSLKSGFYGSVAARLAGRPVIWHLRDRIAEDYLPARVVRITRTALRFLPDFVVCNSAETLHATGLLGDRSALTHLFRPRPRRSQVIGGVINATRHTRSTNLRREPIVIGMVGRLAPWKGQDVFLRAFDTAFRRSPEVRGRIIGSAMFGEEDYERSLRALAMELHLDARIDFDGFTDQIDRELSTIDVLVHASVVAEPFGQVVLEGMAAGLPVVATAAGGPLEIITNEVDGLLTQPGQIDDLAAAMQRLVAEPELRVRLGRAAVTRAGDFGPEIIGAKWLVLYQEVLDCKRRSLFHR